MPKYYTSHISNLRIYLTGMVLSWIGLIIPLNACFGQVPSKPNIVLIFVDDWSWNGSPMRMNEDMINSAMPLLQMPNLQTMATKGMKFRNAYSGAPQCSPSRAALQTGQSCARNGYTVFMNSGGSDYYDYNRNYSQFPVIACVSDMYLEDEEYTIARALNPLGYVCAHYGKWHLRGDPGEINPDLTQPLHAHKWWIWQGGIRVPMIVMGPGIEAGSLSETYVVNYDFLPTFVEWANGEPDDLENIDGESLAGLLHGEKTALGLECRNLYFHYPHYRTSMPMTTMIAEGKWKVMHFFEAPEIPMLFDLNNDVGEVKNVARKNPVKHDMLYKEMMKYLNEVGARIPLYPNPDYDPAVYQDAKEYPKRVLWGPFEGERELEDDEN